VLAENAALSNRQASIRHWHFWCLALHKAATLVTKRSSVLNGDHYEILSPAADTLAAKYRSLRRFYFVL
jgi:uncharacterized protein DUF6880